jgi:C1A family cysteine protease
MANFIKNLRDIVAHNERFAKGFEDYKMDVYEFNDENLDDVVARLCKTIVPVGSAFIQQAFPNQLKAGPAEKDWRSTLMPVVNQKSCGSCWAFAAVAQVESVYKRKDPKFNTPLSPQYLVDCSRGGNRGCK